MKIKVLILIIVLAFIAIFYFSFELVGLRKRFKEIEIERQELQDQRKALELEIDLYNTKQDSIKSAYLLLANEYETFKTKRQKHHIKHAYDSKKILDSNSDSLYSAILARADARYNRESN